MSCAMRRAWAAGLLILWTTSAAWGAIDERTVERAWARVAEADHFERAPLHYEDDEDPNAWVAFDEEEGFTFHVTKGLMAILHSEEEMAGVLGHEIGHVRLGHYQRDVLIDIGRTMMGTNLGRAGDLAQAVGNVDMDLKESRFSREQETEADGYGVDLLVRAGYSPWALHDAMRRFEESGYGTEESGFASHPASEARLLDLADRAREAEGLSADPGDRARCAIAEVAGPILRCARWVE